MLIVCAGMFRSGSTWQYQVACELAHRSGRTVHPCGFLSGETLASFLAAPRDPHAWHLYKTHHPDPIHTALDPADTRVLYSYRDLRDVAYSMAHKTACTFEQAVVERQVLRGCMAADAYWAVFPGAFTMRYEEWVWDNGRFVRGIAAALGLDVSEATADEVADLFRFDRNRERSAQLAARLAGEGVDLSDPVNALRYDAGSLLHWNHLRTGAVGGWRTLATAEERAVLLAECGQWLVDRGYESDTSWVTHAPPSEGLAPLTRRSAASR